MSIQENQSGNQRKAFCSVTGIIDFGDAAYSPLATDIAVASAYAMAGQVSPFDVAAEIAASFHTRLPLEAADIDALPDLIRARLVISVTKSAEHCISDWMSSWMPAPYVLPHLMDVSCRWDTARVRWTMADFSCCTRCRTTTWRSRHSEGIWIRRRCGGFRKARRFTAARRLPRSGRGI